MRPDISLTGGEKSRILMAGCEADFMSAIYGYVFLDGRPIPPSTAEGMAKAMERWGPDGNSTVSEGAAVLGMANLAITPESVHEAPPLREPGDLIFTAAARLDNRDELCETLEIRFSEREAFSDGRLALLAYRKWGEEAPEHLFGDWTLAAWDGLRRKLFLAKDHLGNTGLYYYLRPPVFAFAADPEALFAAGGIERKINETRIASYLTLAPLGDPDETCWTNIHSLPAGHSLTVTPDGKSVRRYWEMKRAPAAGGRKDDEYVAGLLEHYRAAVKVRLRSRRPIGTTLSAGLDSGSLTALAAQALKETGQRLTAFTSVPLLPAAHLVPGSLADEWPLARAVSLRYDNIDHLAIDAATMTPLAGIERAVAIARAPQHAASNEFWIMALHDAARERGVGVMLTGQLGNGGVSWSGGRDPIFWLFAAGKWDAGIKAMARWKKRSGRSWIRTVAGQLVRPVLRPVWRRAQQMLKPGASLWSGYGAVHPDFAARMGLRQAVKAACFDPTYSRPIEPFEERKLTVVRNGTGAGPVWHLYGAAFGMEVRDPTADIRLLEYCVSVPAEQDIFDGGRRMLIRRAMEGLLPPEVQWNTRRGKQAADVALRLLRNPGEMESVLGRLAAHPEASRYLDLELMRRVWRGVQAKATVRTSALVSTLLLRGIMCGCFIEDAGRRSGGTAGRE